VERFLRIEAASGILLLIAAVAALTLANSPWSDVYSHLWHAPVGFRFGRFSFERNVHFWINDGLMTIFFFAVGLEIRREIHRGELSEPRRAALPLVAALGGMLVPASIYFGINRGHASAAGWGVPMATDIAFAVGALTLLGRRVPPVLRIFLLALAVIDDVGAILVIAFFYSSRLSAGGFVVLAAGLLLILALRKVGVRRPWAYIAPAGIAWAGAYLSGIHPTLAGVAVGLMTPAEVWIEGRESVSPLDAIEHALRGWVAFGIMPLFAFANAGVPVGTVSSQVEEVLVFVGVTAGLVLGKPLGILGSSWLFARLGLVTLPADIRWSHVGVVGLVAGVGFTMALFIAELAFADGALLDVAKLGILVASGVAALAGLVIGHLVIPGTAFSSSPALQQAVSLPED
jgi:NhaA family Na+:H+ antiporter